MKNFCNKIFLIIGIILLVIIVALALFANLFRLKQLFESIGDGSIIRGIIFFPFMVSGFYFILKGACETWENGIEKI